MDPIYDFGGMASSSFTMRISVSMQSSQQQTRSENARSENALSRQNQSGTNSNRNTNESDRFESQSATNTTVLIQNSDRILEQIDRIQARLSSQGNSSSATSSNSSSSAETQISSSNGLDSYLQMIRLLSPNEELFEEFLDRMDAFLGGDSAETPSWDAFMTDIANQYGISLTQFQQSFQFDMQVQFAAQSGGEAQSSESTQSTEQVQSQVIQQAEPLVFDLDDDGLELTAVEEGVQFDITGSGQKVLTSFVTGGDAFLALDRNGNGTIDSGKELFGDQHGAKNGIEELGKFDENQDGTIDSQDEVFDRLQLYRELNGDGISQKAELFSLHDAGITAISLDAQAENRYIEGNYMAASTTYRRNDGDQGEVGELYLNYIA